jgi:hypothetical protein
LYSIWGFRIELMHFIPHTLLQVVTLVLSLAFYKVAPQFLCCSSAGATCFSKIYVYRYLKKNTLEVNQTEVTCRYVYKKGIYKL